MKFINIVCAIFILAAFSCKENSIDPLLLQADEIQHEAIDLGLRADSILDARMAEGANKWNIDSLSLLKSAVGNWRNEMVTIPGMEHSHEGHKHEGHIHEGHNHNHDHEKTDVVAQLTPAEIKKVQEGWKDAIVDILASIK